MRLQKKDSLEALIFKRCIYHSKKKLDEQFGRKTNEDVNGNRKLFWKVMSNAKGGKVEICSRIRDGNGKLAQGDEEVRRIWKEYFEYLYNIDIQEQVGVHMCCFDGIRRGNAWEESYLEELKLR